MRHLVLFIPRPQIQNERVIHLHHEGIRVGEIIAYRAWRVIGSSWLRRSDDRLHSVFMQDYIWHPGQAACGDVRSHGVYCFKSVIKSRNDYGYPGTGGQLLFGSVKIWGEIVEHEHGYRSQFAKILSLDYGDPELLEKFRAIYGVANYVQDRDVGCFKTQAQ